MSVDIEPFELSFQRPFTREVAEILKIKNPNLAPVAFKVKTTAPKQYCVRPNSGRIEPGQEVEVNVLLQAMKQEPAPDAKCKDKFLVQSTSIQGDFDVDGGIAAVFENTDKKHVSEKKIKVVWLAADPLSSGISAVTPIKSSLANGHDATPDVSRTYDSPPSTDADATSTAPPAYEAEPPIKSEDSPAPDVAPSFVSAVKHKADLTYEELKVLLEKAEAEIASLKLTSGLRQRNVGGKEVDGEKPIAQLAQAVQQVPDGVSVQVVAALCFLSFLLAYLFF